MSRYQVIIGATINLDDLPGTPSPDGDLAKQLEGVTTEAFLRAINAYLDIQIVINTREGSDFLEELAYKKGLGGWES